MGRCFGRERRCLSASQRLREPASWYSTPVPARPIPDPGAKRPNAGTTAADSRPGAKRPLDEHGQPRRPWAAQPRSTAVVVLLLRESYPRRPSAPHERA